MTTTEQLKKEQETAKLMLEVLNELSGKIQAGERIDVRRVESLLNFFDGFLRQRYPVDRNKVESFFEQDGFRGIPEPEQKVLFEYARGKRLVRSMRSTLRQYQRGADHAGSRFAQSARDFAEFLENHLVREKDSALLLYGQSQAEPGRVGSDKDRKYHLQLKNLKGMFLID